MKIGILSVGQTDPDVMTRIEESLEAVFTEVEFILISKPVSVPGEAFAEARDQYRADIILSLIRRYSDNESKFDRVLGIADIDLFIPKLNFIFGEAECPGKAALVSLWRLRPEFYKRASDTEILVERGTKEAVHELGHTLGLRHCTNPYCVMYFSNSIFETDRKQSLFCNKCYLKTQMTRDILR